MTANRDPRTGRRVLVHAPFGRDAKLIAEVLHRAEMDALGCARIDDLWRELHAGAGAILVADEALDIYEVSILTQFLNGQPSWSDLPVLVMTGSGEETALSRSRLELLDGLGNITLLERPLRTPTLVRAVQVALRSRVRQYQIAEQMEERERLLTRVRDSENLYRSIGESIEFGIWVCTPEGRNIYASPSLLNLVGLTQEEYADFGWKRAMHPDEAEKMVAAWHECVAAGGTWDVVQRFRGVEGHWHPVLVRGGAVRNDRGEIVCWAGINLDISRERKAREALADANDALRRSNEDLEHFAYAASHDLQEPLRHLCAYSQLLQNELSGHLDGKASHFLDFIMTGATRMEMLLRDLLTYTRVTYTSEEPTLIDAAVVCNKTVSSLAVLIQENAVRVICGPLPRVRMHEAHLHELFQNLITNAVKYHGPEPPRISISAAPNGSDWLFSVSDNGMGIDPKYSEVIFGFFKRLHNHDYPGTGIGLALCKKIVERYGGRIWVESEVGRGSTFRFTIGSKEAEMDTVSEATRIAS